MSANAPLALAEDLRVQTARQDVFPGEVFSFEVTLGENPATSLERFELVFPGFGATAARAHSPALL